MQYMEKLKIILQSKYCSFLLFIFLIFYIYITTIFIHYDTKINDSYNYLCSLCKKGLQKRLNNNISQRTRLESLNKTAIKELNILANDNNIQKLDSYNKKMIENK